ncbi:MAG: DUF1343 domain-containing protein [Waddliaceae bacterium]|nr:DUF1343 domain-containing protein [Waddliaceae bacterium]MBT7461436.1 DUF1343 domain-containing protein [Waddliaceae bacterium]
MTLSIAAYAADFSPAVTLGIDVLVEESPEILRGKKIGIIINHTSINSSMVPTFELLNRYSEDLDFNIAALFSPEHGITGAVYAEVVNDDTTLSNIPVYSLYGKTRRPTKEMLQDLDVLIYDIQDIGSRSYTYISTLFYCMEEAAKYGVKIIVADRPNPINGITIDGPMLDDQWRSFVGYVDVPYCHGMTIGELALFFNKEYDVGCDLTVISMKDWERSMSFKDTGLTWIPTSPHIPESDTPFLYPTTGILGELGIVNIGVGYTLPFKLIGAPWIDAKQFSQTLNEQKFPGVHFQPFYYTPFYAKYKDAECEGVYIVITDPLTYKPVSTQYLLIGMLKNLYPQQFKNAIKAATERKEMFCKVNGTEEIYTIMTTEKYIAWELQEVHKERREAFKEHRKQYLLY